MIILLYAQIICILLGVVFLWYASTNRTQLHPYHSNCDSVNLFKRQSWYSPTGYKLHLIGFLMIYAGFLVGAVYFFLKLIS